MSGIKKLQNKVMLLLNVWQEHVIQVLKIMKNHFHGFKNQLIKNFLKRMLYWASAFFGGYGTTANVHQGIQWLQKAAELGDNQALDFLKQIAQAGNVQAQKIISSIVHTINNKDRCERNFIFIK